MFFLIDVVEVASYADENTSNTHEKLPHKVLEKLEQASRNIFEWFFNNAKKDNPQKCNFLSSIDTNSTKYLLAFSTLKINIHINVLVSHWS